MFTLVIAGTTAAIASYVTHSVKESRNSAEAIAQQYGEARARVTNTIAGAEALAAKLKSTL